MPPIPAGANARNKRYFTLSFIDASGRRKAVNVPFVGNPATVPGATMVERIGELSNAAMVESSTTVGTVVNPSDPAVVVFDETYSAVSTVLRLTFQNAEGNIVGVDVPAPDITVFQADRMTFNASANSATIDAILAVLNHIDGVVFGTYTYRNGYLTSHRAPRSLPATLPSAIVEPGVGDLPGGGPDE